DGVHHPADQLADAGLPLRRPQRAPEVLLGHDVRGVLGPALRELHPPLLEGVAALLVVGDDGVADLPLDLVEWVDAVLREVPLESQTTGSRPDLPLPGRQRWPPFERAGKVTRVKLQRRNSAPARRSCQVETPQCSQNIGVVDRSDHYLLCLTSGEPWCRISASCR